MLEGMIMGRKKEEDVLKGVLKTGRGVGRIE